LFCPLSPEAYLLTGIFFIYHVIGTKEASPSPCTSVMLIEEDVSLSLNMTSSLVNEV
jgi:hypothetical protein